MMWTVSSILDWTVKRFKEAEFDTPLLDAQLLLCHALGVERIRLYTDNTKPLSEIEKNTLREYVRRRLSGEPVAFILKEKHWYNLKLYVDENVLIPRPETECLVDFVVESAAEAPQLIYDFCTGSGCIALALAQKFPTAQVVGVDISPAALAVAKRNAELNGVSNVTWLEGDVSQPTLWNTLAQRHGAADIVTANPPYVSESEWQNLNVSVKNFEPKLALVAHDDGLALGQHILTQAPSLLKETGVFAMELAEGQPQRLFPELVLEKISFQSPAQKKSHNVWFALCDLSAKARFLCQIRSSSAGSRQTTS